MPAAPAPTTTTFLSVSYTHLDVYKRQRFDHLEKAAAADSHGRLNTCRKELDFISRRERYVDVLLDLQERGELPVRIVHNDTKINNVMLDRETDKEMCIRDRYCKLGDHDFPDAAVLFCQRLLRLQGLHEMDRLPCG